MGRRTAPSLLYANDGKGFRQDLVEAELFLPWSAQQSRGEIFASCEVLEERADEDGAVLRVRGEQDTVNGFRERFAKA